MEQLRLGHQQRLEEIQIQADIEESKALYQTVQPTGVRWIDGLRGSVRPIITYAFFMLFVAVKGAALWSLAQHADLSIIEALPKIWDEETSALFAAVMSFWFGQRALTKFRKG
ncbi:MAG: hypothetical protein HQK87_11355 [Nitrospinae bacterium]|nr:hypothetical protein [Nitrospinota bacterium]